jgi:hypothetical protein
MIVEEYIAIANNESVSDKLTENYIVNNESPLDLLINDKINKSLHKEEITIDSSLNYCNNFDNFKEYLEHEIKLFEIIKEKKIFNLFVQASN